MGTFQWIALGIFGVWLFWFEIIQILFPPVDKHGNPVEPGPGMAGDMFGSLTALFSGLAFAGIVTTILLQREELKLSRDEFYRQRLETRLFSILRLWNEHVSSLQATRGKTGLKINIRSETGWGEISFLFRKIAQQVEAEGRDVPSEELIGRRVLEAIADELPHPRTKHGRNAWKRISNDERSPSVEDLASWYEQKYHHDYSEALGPYFRLLYNSVRLVEKSDVSDVEKLEYTKVIRAHLTAAELRILLFNCTTSMGDAMKPLVERHTFLKHIAPNDKVTYEMLAAQYSKTAFKAPNT